MRQTSTRLPSEATHRRRSSAETPEPQQILVGLLCPIGDTLLATPALAALRRRYPRAQINVIVSASNAGILDGNADINERIFVPAHGEAAQVLRFAQGVRGISRERKKYDVVVNLSAAGSFVTFLAGLRLPTYRLRTPPLWWLVGTSDQRYRARHTIDHYLLAVAPLLDRSASAEERIPRLHLTAHDRTAARSLLREHSLAPSNLLITMHVGGDGFNGRKRWATKRFAEVARTLIDRFGAHVLLIGGSADVELAQETAALIGDHVTVLAGRTPLRVTAALIETSALFIGNDSGPLHIAAALGTAAVGIYGPSDWNEFHPVGKVGSRQRVIHSDLHCSPCFRFIGNDPWWVPNLCQSRDCLKAITPQEVIAVAADLLRSYSVGPERVPTEPPAPRPDETTTRRKRARTLR